MILLTVVVLARKKFSDRFGHKQRSTSTGRYKAAGARVFRKVRGELPCSGRGGSECEEDWLRADPRRDAVPGRGGGGCELAEITKPAHLVGVWPCPSVRYSVQSVAAKGNSQGE